MNNAVSNCDERPKNMFNVRREHEHTRSHFHNEKEDCSSMHTTK